MANVLWQNGGRLGIIAVSCILAVLASQASAQDESVLVEPPAGPPAAAEAAPMAPMAPAAAECCPAPCITYRTHLGARRMLRCQSQVQLTMVADNPADCAECPVEVPLCIPACCTGAPVVSSRCGLLGRGVVEYCWPCGFRAEVVFRARGGDVVVHYRG